MTGPAPLGHNQPPSFEQDLRTEHRAVFLRFEALQLERDKLPAVVNTEEENLAVGRFIVSARETIRAVEAAHEVAKRPFKEKADAVDKLFLTKGLKGQIERLQGVVQALANDYAERKERERRRELERQAEERRAQEEAAAYEAAALRDAGSHSAAEVAASQSEHLGKQADKLAAKAEGGAADVLRTRAAGVTASGRTRWSYEILDEEKIDLNVLRDAIYGHELAQIIQRFVDGGGRECPGLRIYEKTIATFR